MRRTEQRSWEDVRIGDPVPAVAFPLSAYRLVMAAAGNRDYNSMHHNDAYARATGAPSLYANNLFLLGMWERTVREFIGCAGTIRALRGFRMRTFSTADDTVTVRGEVVGSRAVDDSGVLMLRMWSENEHDVVVGPGEVEVTLPYRGGPR